MPKAGNCEDAVKAWYGRAEKELRDFLPFYGYKILSSRPCCPPKCKLMLVGYQPGGGAEDWEEEKAAETHLHWPSRGEFEDRDWIYARRMRELFGEHLRGYVGTNAIWPRFPSAKKYRELVSKERRAMVEAFCKAGVIDLVRIMRPQKIVAIGFSTLSLFAASEPALAWRGRVLVRRAVIDGFEVMAVLHPTGGRISKEGMTKMSEYLDRWMRA